MVGDGFSDSLSRSPIASMTEYLYGSGLGNSGLAPNFPARSFLTPTKISLCLICGTPSHCASRSRASTR